YQTLTDDEGHFEISGLNPGEYILLSFHETALERILWVLSIKLQPGEVKNLILCTQNALNIETKVSTETFEDIINLLEQEISKLLSK
ncbi:hypothetical protein J7M23_01580, partial [Candidatus Sumerlaeota bacterium]|nr:hypothetical protein [Candidatus Sumerlaeota bacterium]